RLGTAPDLRDRRVQVLEDLLEHLAVALRDAARLRGEIAESLGIAAGADVLEVRPAAEHAGVPAQDDRPDLGVARELQAGLAEVAGHLAVHGVEALAALHHQRPDGAFALDADEIHQQIRGMGSPSISATSRFPKPVSRMTFPFQSGRQVPTMAASRPS